MEEKQARRMDNQQAISDKKKEKQDEVHKSQALGFGNQISAQR